MSQRKGQYGKLYAALVQFRQELDKKPEKRGKVSFQQIEEWAGMRLPLSAYKHREWWSNNSDIYRNGPKPWGRALLRTEDVDMRARTLFFRVDSARLTQESAPPMTKERLETLFPKLRSRGRGGSAPPQGVGLSDVNQPYVALTGAGRHPLRGALKGMLRIVAGTDLTKPADPEWADRS